MACITCMSHDLLTMYICHMTLLLDPRQPSSSGDGGPIGLYGVPIVYERSFKWKVGHFRNLCVVSHGKPIF